jgi:hypothetical protein
VTSETRSALRSGRMSQNPRNADLATGWRVLMEGFPWFAGEGSFPLPAYSEFMPAPRLGRKPCGDRELLPFSDGDDYGWAVTEVEEEYELKPGLEHLAGEVVGALSRFGQGKPENRIAGHKGRNLVDNPYCPPELVAHAGRLPRERYVVLLPLALSRTQDDKGRIRWTFFGSSEQGPEQAFWQGFYSAPGRERPEGESLAFLVRLLAEVYGEPIAGPAGLRPAGFRVLPSEPNPRFPYWHDTPLPSWTRPLVADPASSFEDVRYLLTFRPFGRLPETVRRCYLAGQLVLLPYPGSLVFWGESAAIRLQDKLPLAMQIPLLGLLARREGPGGLRVPQSGWFHEVGSCQAPCEVHESLLVDRYKRTNRWDRIHRHEDDLAGSSLEDKVARVLFSTAPDALDLYGKPMARNCQVWTRDSELLLDGPNASAAEIRRAGEAVARGGSFRYRFVFPAMRVGRHEVYWHRPLAAFWSEERSQAQVLSDAPLGGLTAYRADSPNPARPIWLWPQLLRREPYLAALRGYVHLHEHFTHQTSLNVLALLDDFELRGGRAIARDLARHMLHLAGDESLDVWVSSLPGRSSEAVLGQAVRRGIDRVLEPPAPARPPDRTAIAPADLAESLTYAMTATRAFEEGLWNDIAFLASCRYVNKDNADCVQDPRTLVRLVHRRRDLEALGHHLMERHRRAIHEAGLEGRALWGELPFRWTTDFDFPLFGGWKENQDGRSYERDILVVIPGRNRRQAVVLADHYDTAYMEDEYYKDRGGSGARLAAAGADDNHSATATLLQAAPVFLKLARQGRLERDVWLLHLTGEEFPADCMGARHFCRSLVEGTLRMRGKDGGVVDLSATRVAGVFVMDMIAHNRDREKNVFQMSPGVGAAALELVRHAYDANRLWNAQTDSWNRGAERRGHGRGQRSPDGIRIPDIALHPRLHGEIRTAGNPLSSLYNTDGQIFSDVGVPVVLFMEDYDINRTGYHDTRDTLENIDLDYGAAVAAIAIEAAARAAAEADGPQKK